MTGVTYIDQLAKDARVVSTDAAVTFTGEVDRVYLNAPNDLVITDKALNRTITVRKSAALPDAVLWNPYIAKTKTMADMGADEWTKMVCVEAGAIGSKVRLSPSKTWTGSIVFTARQLK